MAELVWQGIDERGAMSGLVMVEGLPGAGKSTVAHGLAEWLALHGHAAVSWPEGRADHPVDFERVALLEATAWDRLRVRFPEWESRLLSVSHDVGGVLVVKHGLLGDLPPALGDELRGLDAYDGAITAGLYSRALTDSWRRFGAAPPPAEVQVWECVLIQNPVCAFIARLDESPLALERHVRGLVEAVRPHDPALVYLDVGDPLPALESAARERPDEWLQFVIEYHTQQGYGRRRGLDGFDGYVEFMRHRRALELDLVSRLPLPTLVVPVDPDRRDETSAEIRRYVAAHLGVPAA
ncbi:hypothetical protein [Microbacterium kyungheense]|nr:hypothetical protein [Microbacterium kyungheense]